MRVVLGGGEGSRGEADKDKAGGCKSRGRREVDGSLVCPTQSQKVGRSEGWTQSWKLINSPQSFVILHTYGHTFSKDCSQTMASSSEAKSIICEHNRPSRSIWKICSSLVLWPRYAQMCLTHSDMSKHIWAEVDSDWGSPVKQLIFTCAVAVKVKV